MKQSSLERTFDTLRLQLAPDLPEPEREYRFHHKRKFRFDFAWIDDRVACEVEGVISAKSRHTTISGYTKDCDKYNLAAEMGWRVFRYTVIHLNEDPHAVFEQLRRVIGEYGGCDG